MIKVEMLVDALLGVDQDLEVVIETPFGTFDSFSAELESHMRIVGNKLVLPSYGRIPELEYLTQPADEPPIIEESLPEDDDDELHLTMLGGGGG